MTGPSGKGRDLGAHEVDDDAARVAAGKGDTMATRLPGDDGPSATTPPTSERRSPASRGAPLRAVRPEDVADPGDDWRGALLYEVTRRGRLIQNVEANAITVLRFDPAWAGVLAFDDFRSTIVATRPPPFHKNDAPAEPKAGEWSDQDTTRAQAWLMRTYEIKLSREAVAAAVAVVAHANKIHPVRTWLDSLTWDGTPRVESWLSTYLGAIDSTYTRAVARMMLVSAVARIYRPGCKADTMAVLEGPQGARKSTALACLFGEWFSDTPFDLESKDRFLSIQGVWCKEVAELDGFGKADTNRIKSFLSSPSDTYRPPYGRHSAKVARQSIMIGTTNADTYLADATGNRRFWPVKCGRIDLDAIGRDRAQLWAEAVQMFRDGAHWWPTDEEAALGREEQFGRVQTDAWQEKIGEWLARQPPDARVTIGDVLGDALAIERQRWSQPDQNRAARCLTLCGWKRRQRREDDGRRTWAYEREREPEPTVAVEPVAVEPVAVEPVAVEPPQREPTPEERATWAATPDRELGDVLRAMAPDDPRFAGVQAVFAARLNIVHADGGPS